MVENLVMMSSKAMPSTGLAANIRVMKGSFDLEASLSLPSSGFTIIFGDTGSGKTTLLNALAGVEKPSSGFVSFRGRVFHDSHSGIDLPVEGRRTGYIFQEGLLFPRMTVRENLEFAMVHGKPGEGAFSFDEAVSGLEISLLLERLPDTLSGGQRQRVAMARTALSDPDLLLADEPMQSLDAASRSTAMDFLVTWSRRREMKVVLVTHNVAEMFRLADDMVILSNGRVVGCGKPGVTLFSKSRFTPQVRESIDCLFEADAASSEGSGPWPFVRVAASGVSSRDRIRLAVSACPPMRHCHPGVAFTMGFPSTRVRVAPKGFEDIAEGVYESLGYNALQATVVLDSFGNPAMDPGIGCLVKPAGGIAERAGVSFEPGEMVTLFVNAMDIVPIDLVADATVVPEEGGGR